MSNKNGEKESYKRNPFIVESPEKLSQDEIADLFVEKYTELTTIKRKKHTFVWGSRGSGKSMMLRYLEPKCQKHNHSDFEDIFDQPEPFFAVYMPIKEGRFNKTEFDLLNNRATLVITEHLLNLDIAERCIATVREQIPNNIKREKDESSLVDKISNLFDPASIASSIERVDNIVNKDKNPLLWLEKLFEKEKAYVGKYLKKNTLCGGDANYEGGFTGYHDFLLPLIENVLEYLNISDVSIYLLIDDAFRLNKQQQKILNSWVANRDQNTVCFKISAQRDLYETFKTRDGGLIEEPHDFSDIDIDELYTNSKERYYKKVKLISNRRLNLSRVPVENVEELLPPNEHQKKMLEDIKKELAEEWEQEEESVRKSDYIDRYAKPRLFQMLKSQKQERKYAGFENLVHISSGIVRAFLEPCYLMFDEYLSEGINPEDIKEISPEKQQEIIKKYSEDFILKKFEEIRKDLPPEDWSIIDSLSTLVESLGRVFYERLHDPKAREARLFSFTLRGELDENLKKVLKLGLKYGYFQLRTYSTKSGGGREKWYILNRRLCPIYKLDPTGFEGRLTLTPELLNVACKDPDRFVKLRLKKISDKQYRIKDFGGE
ncbi:MAG: hypothetical protein ACOCT9_01020 [archaeon]